MSRAASHAWSTAVAVTGPPRSVLPRAPNMCLRIEYERAGVAFAAGPASAGLAKVANLVGGQCGAGRPQGPKGTLGTVEGGRDARLRASRIFGVQGNKVAVTWPLKTHPPYRQPR